MRELVPSAFGCRHTYAKDLFHKSSVDGDGSRCTTCNNLPVCGSGHLYHVLSGRNYQGQTSLCDISLRTTWLKQMEASTPFL
jgi:hypothetical protein